MFFNNDFGQVTTAADRNKYQLIRSAQREHQKVTFRAYNGFSTMACHHSKCEPKY